MQYTVLPFRALRCYQMTHSMYWFIESILMPCDAVPISEICVQSGWDVVTVKTTGYGSHHFHTETPCPVWWHIWHLISLFYFSTYLFRFRCFPSFYHPSVPITHHRSNLLLNCHWSSPLTSHLLQQVLTVYSCIHVIVCDQSCQSTSAGAVSLSCSTAFTLSLYLYTASIFLPLLRGDWLMNL